MRRDEKTTEKKEGQNKKIRDEEDKKRDRSGDEMRDEIRKDKKKRR